MLVYHAVAMSAYANRLLRNDGCTVRLSVYANIDSDNGYGFPVFIPDGSVYQSTHHICFRSYRSRASLSTIRANARVQTSAPCVLFQLILILNLNLPSQQPHHPHRIKRAS